MGYLLLHKILIATTFVHITLCSMPRQNRDERLKNKEPSLEEEQYMESIEVEYNSTECFWCNNSTPDSHHRGVTITTYDIFLAPGTCVVNQSPDFPTKYPHNIDLRYTYTTNPCSIITLDVPKGGMQISRGCHRDKLIAIARNRVAKRCGYIKNFFYSSLDINVLYVRFATNHRLHWHGYNGTVCASGFVLCTPPTTTEFHNATTTISSTTTPTPIACDDICGNINGFNGGRIAAGTDAAKVLPWFVIVDVLRDNVFVRCSGYLISRRHVVTSAFCFYQTTPKGTANTVVRVTAGEYDLTQPETPAAQVLYSSTIDIFPEYNHNIGNGVKNGAVITLKGNGFVLNKDVSPICLHKPSYGFPPQVIIAGFGWSEKNHPVLNMTQNTLNTCPFPIGPDLLCIWIPPPKTPCHGDAGTALMYENNGVYYAAGHINAVTTSKCPMTGSIHPAVKTSYFGNWIDEVTGFRVCNPDDL